jgi:WD repeat-containing protein 61
MLFASFFVVKAIYQFLQLLMSGADDKRLVLHDVREADGAGQVASMTGHSSWLSSVELSSDGRMAVSGSVDSTIRFWDLGTRTCVSSLSDNGEVWGVSWNPTGKGVVSGGEDGYVRWWRMGGS